MDEAHAAHVWRGLIEPTAIDSQTGDSFSLQISLAISAKRQADAAQAVAEALWGVEGTSGLLHLLNPLDVRNNY
jgi:hypothetical protein